MSDSILPVIERLNAAQISRGVRERRQNLIFAVGLRLREGNSVACLTVDRFESQRVIAIELCDGPGNQRFEFLALTNLARHVTRHSFTRGTIH